mmetsp:Transcript_56044/g.126465  ORF Transcript_56044/g.126465 Transcript_56044/m.126465 type:complete len:250 (+) Transcript_56044:204-953(+)
MVTSAAPNAHGAQGDHVVFSTASVDSDTDSQSLTQTSSISTHHHSSDRKESAAISHTVWTKNSQKTASSHHLNVQVLSETVSSSDPVINTTDNEFSDDDLESAAEREDKAGRAAGSGAGQRASGASASGAAEEAAEQALQKHKSKSRPCKGKRDRFRRLMCRIEHMVDMDPDMVTDILGSLPPSIEADAAQKAKVFSKVAMRAEQARTIREGLVSSGAAATSGTPAGPDEAASSSKGNVPAGKAKLISL